MFGLDQLTNACQPVTLAGKSYPVRQLKLREWGELQAWLKGVAPSPIAVAMRGLAELEAAGAKPSQEIQDAVFRQAQAEARSWPPRVASPEWFKAVDLIDGGHARLVLAALRAGGTEIDEDEAAELARAAKSAELVDLVRACVHGEHRAPKGAEAAPAAVPSPTTGAAGSSTSGASRAGRTGKSGSSPSRRSSASRAAATSRPS